MFRMPEIITIKQGRWSSENLHKFVHTDKCPIRVNSLCSPSCINDFEVSSTRVEFNKLFYTRNGSKRHTLITVNARCKQTAQLTAKPIRSGIRICIRLTLLTRVLLWLKRTQNFTNPQLQYLVTSKAQPPGF